MLTEKQRELVENIWRYDCGHLGDMVFGNEEKDISGMSGWVVVEDWTGGTIQTVATAKGLLGSLVTEGYVTVDDEDGDTYFQFTQKLADEWGMTREESERKYLHG